MVGGGVCAGALWQQPCNPAEAGGRLLEWNHSMFGSPGLSESTFLQNILHPDCGMGLGIQRSLAAITVHLGVPAQHGCTLSRRNPASSASPTHLVSPYIPFSCLSGECNGQVACSWLNIATDIALRGLRYNMQRTAARSQQLLCTPSGLSL